MPRMIAACELCRSTNLRCEFLSWPSDPSTGYADEVEEFVCIDCGHVSVDRQWLPDPDARPARKSDSVEWTFALLGVFIVLLMLLLPDGGAQ